jgi:MFS-type transporter involved in bile tolerance (Atg22 family)
VSSQALLCMHLLVREYGRAGADVTSRTVRTMLTENSTPKTQARVFSFFAFSGNLGIFLGPLIGKCLYSAHSLG